MASTKLAFASARVAPSGNDPVASCGEAVMNPSTAAESCATIAATNFRSSRSGFTILVILADSLDRLQRLFQIGNQIFLVFDANREPDASLVDSHRIANILAHRAVRRGRRVRGKRLHPTQRLCIEEDFDGPKKARSFFALLELETHHRAKTFLLLYGKIVLRMALQAWIRELAHLGM